MRSIQSTFSIYNLARPADEGVRATYRREAFQRLHAYSPQIATHAERLATELLDSSAIPRAGELLPVLLDQALQLDSKQARRLGGTWFLLYLYTMLADAQIDSARPTTPKDVMTAAALLDSGLQDLRLAVGGTAYEAVANLAIKTAIGGQLRDHPTEAGARDEKSAERDAIDKNAYLVSLAAAYAALDTSGADVVRFVSKLSLALQYLDDVTDRCEDFKSGNFTFLLLRSNHEFRYRIEPGADELLAQITCTGSLELTLSRTTDSLNQAVETIQSFPEGPFKLQLKAYLALIVEEVQSVRLLVQQQQEASVASGTYLRRYSDELGRALSRIAFSS